MAKTPPGTAKVPREIVDKPDAQCVPALLFPLLDTTQGEKSDPAGVSRAQASCDLRRCPLLDVELEFLIAARVPRDPGERWYEAAGIFDEASASRASLMPP